MFKAVWTDSEKKYTCSGLSLARVYAYAKEKEKEGYSVTFFETYGRGLSVISREDVERMRRKA